MQNATIVLKLSKCLKFEAIPCARPRARGVGGGGGGGVTLIRLFEFEQRDLISIVVHRMVHLLIE